MTLTFADTHNMIAYLTKSNASEGFNQIIDFLSGSSIKLQALVDKKKVVITKATIRDAHRLDDAEGIECLPNEEIFDELARMGYEKPSTKLTFYKVDEGTDEVHVDYVPAEGVVSAADDEVPAVVDEPSIPLPPPPTQPPPPSQDIPLTSHVQLTPPQSPQAQPQPSQDAGILMDLLQNLLDTCTTLTRRVEHLEQDKISQALEITKLKQRVKKLEKRTKASKLQRLKKGRMIVDMYADVDVTLKDVAKDVQDAEMEESADVQGRKAESQAQIYHIDLEHADKVLSMQDVDIKPAELQEVVEVVTTAKLITKVVTAASATIAAAALQLTIAAAPTLTTAPSDARRRKGVTIEQMDEEDSRALKRLSESQDEKTAKKQKLDEESTCLL
nr:hypothetical protein [Tanacetum cinerariifolium]